MPIARRNADGTARQPALTVGELIETLLHFDRTLPVLVGYELIPTGDITDAMLYSDPNVHGVLLYDASETAPIDGDDR